MKNLIITGILGSIVFVLLLFQYPHKMLSPGELSQGHQDINQQCFSCHQAFGGIQNAKCIACHELADIGRDTISIVSGNNVREDKVLFHQNIGKYACTACHTDHAGLNPAEATKGFEHDMLPAPVLNDCLACHPKPEDKLHLQLTDACANCHSTSSWKLALGFNHDMVQPSIKNNCVGCHEIPGDDFHRTLKDECSKCHGTDKWLPSTFDHASYFVLDSDHNSKCSTCHPGNKYESYTCYGCHEHTVGNILGEHREEGITNLTNCVSCHKSSDEREGGGGDGDDD